MHLIFIVVFYTNSGSHISAAGPLIMNLGRKLKVYILPFSYLKVLIMPYHITARVANIPEVDIL